MEKQKIFNEMIENILSCVTITEFNSGELISDKENILLKDVDNNLHYFAYVPYELNGEKIHGNRRNTLAHEFIKRYSFNSLKDLFDKKIEAYEKHLQLEKQNKYRLDDLYKSIKYIEKYDRWGNKGVKLFILDKERYCIEFNCNKNNYSSDNIRICNSANYENFDFRFNYKTEQLTKDEIEQKIKKLSEIYEKVFQEKEAIKESKKQSELKTLKIQNKLFELYKSGEELLFKNKKSFIGFKDGVRFAVGEGKAGKYYKCNYSKLCDLIIKKGITEYVIINKDISTYNMTNKELNNLEYKKII